MTGLAYELDFRRESRLVMNSHLALDLFDELGDNACSQAGFRIVADVVANLANSVVGNDAIIGMLTHRHRRA
jgi:hypothetical protein